MLRFFRQEKLVPGQEQSAMFAQEELIPAQEQLGTIKEKNQSSWLNSLLTAKGWCSPVKTLATTYLPSYFLLASGLPKAEAALCFQTISTPFPGIYQLSCKVMESQFADMLMKGCIISEMMPCSGSYLFSTNYGQCSFGQPICTLSYLVNVDACVNNVLYQNVTHAYCPQDTGTIVGIVAGTLAAAACVGTTVYCCFFKKKPVDDHALPVRRETTRLVGPEITISAQQDEPNKKDLNQLLEDTMGAEWAGEFRKMAQR